MLSYILKQVSKEVGTNLLNATHRLLLVDDVNRAAKELYESSDLFDSLDEEVFDIYTANENQASLPWYVEFIRGLRNFDGRYAVDLEDPKNRYFQGINTEIWNQRLRNKRRSAVAREVENQSRITFRIVETETTDIVFTIVGPTHNASQVTETVTLSAGSLEVETTKQYTDGIRKISKDRVTDNDVIIEDVNDNELGRIPNHLLETKYTVIQVMDSITSTASDPQNAVEVLFKRPFVPLINDGDEFQCGSRYDDAIVWKILEHRAKDLTTALALRAKSTEVVNSILADAKNGTRERINFVPGFFWDKNIYNVCGDTHRRSY